MTIGVLGGGLAPQTGQKYVNPWAILGKIIDALVPEFGDQYQYQY